MGARRSTTRRLDFQRAGGAARFLSRVGVFGLPLADRQSIGGTAARLGLMGATQTAAGQGIGHGGGGGRWEGEGKGREAWV